MTHHEMEQRITDLLWRITGANDCFLLHRHLLESHKDHLDKGFQTPGKDDEAFFVTFGEVEELLEFAKIICNRLLSDLNRGVFVSRSSNVYDVDELFERVERGSN